MIARLLRETGVNFISSPLVNSASRRQVLARRWLPSLLLSGALMLTAMPTFAQEAMLPGSGSMRNDLADAPLPRGRSLLPDAMTLSDRALYLASDINRLLAPGKSGVGNADSNHAGSIKNLLHSAMALLGTPYRWGGTTPDNGFDCSGLVSYLFRSARGIELPRISRDMATNGELISDRSKLTAGDLVFFGRRGRVDHVGIYVGEGQFVHAPSRGKDVMVSSLESGYWSDKYMQARRVADI